MSTDDKKPDDLISVSMLEQQVDVASRVRDGETVLSWNDENEDLFLFSGVVNLLAFIHQELNHWGVVTLKAAPPEVESEVAV